MRRAARAGRTASRCLGLVSSQRERAVDQARHLHIDRKGRDQATRSAGKLIIERLSWCVMPTYRRCQTKSSWRAKTVMPRLSGRKLAPLGKSGGAVEFENFAAVEVAFLVEMILDRRLDRGEFL